VREAVSLEGGTGGLGGSATDGGTTQRVGGTFLTWFNDHTSQVFVIVTCNNYSKIPPEYTRMGWWDGIFFVDNPIGCQVPGCWQEPQQFAENRRVERNACTNGLEAFYQPLDGSALPFGGSIAKYGYFEKRLLLMLPKLAIIY